jgi:hypothetical protein
MRAIRTIFVSALFASALVAPSAAAPADPGGTPAPVSLAGKNVIVGDKGAVIDVRIDTPAVWSGRAEDVKITGGGDLPGFVLTKPAKYTYDHPVLGRIESSYDEVVASASRLPARGITKDLTLKQRTLLLMPMKEVLKPGNYKLYLIADEEPVRITLTLTGLLGKQRIEPTAPTGLDMARLPERTSLTAPVAGVFTAGDDRKLERPGLVYDVIAIEAKDSPEGEIGSCVYRGKPRDEEQGEPISYGPHCIGGQGSDYSSTTFHYTTNFFGGKLKMMYGLTSTLEADDWTVSNWFRGTGTIGKGASYGYWLNFK